eukprot:5830849-Pyramimonas_sp.AAC.1
MYLAAHSTPAAFPSARACPDEKLEDPGLPTPRVKLAPQSGKLFLQWAKWLRAADRYLERAGQQCDRRGVEPHSV